MRSIWLTICSLYSKFPLIIAFLLIVVITNLTSFIIGVSWESVGLGLVLSLISTYFLRRLIMDTYIDLAAEQYKVSREAAEEIVKGMWSRRK